MSCNINAIIGISVFDMGITRRKILSGYRVVCNGTFLRILQADTVSCRHDCIVGHGHATHIIILCLYGVARCSYD